MPYSRFARHRIFFLGLVDSMNLGHWKHTSFSSFAVARCYKICDRFCEKGPRACTVLVYMYQFKLSHINEQSRELPLQNMAI